MANPLATDQIVAYGMETAIARSSIHTARTVARYYGAPTITVTRCGPRSYHLLCPGYLLHSPPMCDAIWRLYDVMTWLAAHGIDVERGWSPA